MSGGLYQELVKAGQLVEHTETSQKSPQSYKVIQPEQLDFISYPFEWSFSQLKDSALLTLKIQQRALTHSMTLRDASAYNIQLVSGQLKLIDTLSLGVYEPGKPWVAYRQFCQHFLAPLALMSYRDPGLLQLMRVYIDGLPLDLTAKLLPTRARLRPALAAHISLQANYQKRYATSESAGSSAKLSLQGQYGLIDNLIKTIQSLKLPASKTEWGDYYDNTNYSKAALAAKTDIVKGYLSRAKPKRVLDLGSNNGHFSRLASSSGIFVISADIDPIAVEQNYLLTKKSSDKNLAPILIDLTNPSPGLGWNNQERPSFMARAQADAVVALALVHHLAIGNNLPLGLVADFLAQMGESLIIEFVPKSDSQVRRLLASREDIFDNYSVEGFETAFTRRYKIIDKQKVSGSDRTIYLMKRTYED